MPEVTERKNLRKERIGIVTSDKMQKTIVVQIKRKALHPLYGKVIEKAQKFKVHDEKNEAKTGDRVRIAETRPLSKDKRWRLVEVLSRGQSDSSKDLKESVGGKAS
jgi:small subunit ribosomal protein S17